MSSPSKTPGKKTMQRPENPAPLQRPVTDNHCHLDHEDEAEVSELLQRAREVGVTRSITIGCDLPGARRTIELVEQFEQLRGAVAIHPNEAVRLAAKGELDTGLQEIEELSAHPGIVAVSETGFDFYHDDESDEATFAAQESSFRFHIALAKKRGRAMQIHNREADAATLALLDDEGAPEITVMHCFSSDAVMARECVDRGMFLSFAGNMTFKNAGELRSALLEVPLDRTLVETDSPYLTPMPKRGKPNSSYMIPHTVRMMADVRDVPVEAVCEGIAEATQRAYGTW